MADIVRFLKRTMQNDGKFTVYELMHSVDIKDAYDVLKQLERWGYIERIDDNMYQVKKETLTRLGIR